MTTVILTSNKSTSKHIFESQSEASNFVSWITNYNMDLDVTVENTDNEQDDIPNECSTFI